LGVTKAAANSRESRAVRPTPDFRRICLLAPADLLGFLMDYPNFPADLPDFPAESPDLPVRTDSRESRANLLHNPADFPDFPAGLTDFPAD